MPAVNMDKQMNECHENKVIKVDKIDVRVHAGTLDYAVQQRAAILENWQHEVQKTPALYNGELYMAPEARLNNGVFEADFIRDDYATFLYWRKDREPLRPWHIFGVGVIVSCDNVLIAAQMAPSTAVASKIYFPAGSIDDHDVKNGRVDYEYNMCREVKEETGLDLNGATAEEGFWLVTSNRSIALFKRYYFDLNAEELISSIKDTLSRQNDPELDDVIAISSAGMMGDLTPDYVRTFADWHFSGK